MTEFSVPGPQLAEAAAWASRLIPARPVTPVLGGVVLDAEQADRDASTGRLSLSVFDFDAAGTVTLDAEITEPGRVLVSGNLLAAVTKTLGARDVARLDHSAAEGDNPSGTTLTLDVGKAAGWELPTLDHRDYPQLPDAPEPVETLDAAALAEGLGLVLPSVSDDPTTPGLAGVYVSAEQGGPLVLAATDRYRLAYVEVPRDGDDAIAEMLLPGGLARHLASAARASDGPVRLLDSGSRAGLAGPTHRISGAVLEGHMPWRRILLDEDKAGPGAGGGRWLLDTDTLRRAVDRAATVLGNGESLSIDLTGDQAVIAPTLGGKGRASHTCDVVEAEQPDSADLARLGVSGVYLHAALAFLGTAPRVELRSMGRAWMPVLLRPAGEDGEILPGRRFIVAQQRQAVVRQEAAA